MACAARARVSVSSPLAHLYHDLIDGIPLRHTLFRGTFDRTKAIRFDGCEEGEHDGGRHQLHTSHAHGAQHTRQWIRTDVGGGTAHVM